LKWQDLSRNNINKSIAMVIDNLVYFAPMLKEEIKSGKCSVSGDFTLEDVTLLKSLINNGELPLDLIIVK
jgi:SecD/SecF fusion protein